MENVVYINKQARQEEEFAALASQIEDRNKCSAMKQLITTALAPHHPAEQQAL